MARVEQWPIGAKHIKQVEMEPPGELGPESTGRLHLNNGVKSGWPGASAAFTVTEFNPYRNWKWVAGFLWLTSREAGHNQLAGPGTGGELQVDQVAILLFHPAFDRVDIRLRYSLAGGVVFRLSFSAATATSRARVSGSIISFSMPHLKHGEPGRPIY